MLVIFLFVVPSIVHDVYSVYAFIILSFSDNRLIFLICVCIVVVVVVACV